MSTDILDRPAAARRTQTQLSVVDCDIHPQFAKPDEIQAFLPERWREYVRAYGGFYRQPLADTLAHPRMAPDVARADAWPPNGAPPGGDLAFMQHQHLDANNVAHGMLMPLNRGPGNQRNLEYGAALATAVNDWQIARWVEPDPRLHASIVVTQEHPPFAIAEIEKRAGDRRFAQVMLPPKSLEPQGRRRYWPLYEAAVAHGLPLALHVGGIAGYPPTASGWPSYYVEEQHTNVQGMQSLITSMVIEGVFEQFPTLKVVLVEGGIAWLPALKWRLDKHWKRLKSEAPHLKRLPSEYIHDHFWLTTQPLDEPDRDGDLVEAFEMVGVDRIMFSTDYPHWDFDEPRFVVSKLKMSADKLARIFYGNAKELYGLI
jgi:predicted TIM-barrel fold metal-dependent hydrolase